MIILSGFHFTFTIGEKPSEGGKMSSQYIFNMVGTQNISPLASNKIAEERNIIKDMHNY